MDGVIAYNPTIQECIRNFVRTEEPVTTQQVARRIPEARLADVDRLLWTMVHEGLLRRVWDDDLYADVKFQL